jgi:hypothetical protein
MQNKVHSIHAVSSVYKAYRSWLINIRFISSFEVLLPCKLLDNWWNTWSCIALSQHFQMKTASIALHAKRMKRQRLNLYDNHRIAFSNWHIKRIQIAGRVIISAKEVKKISTTLNMCMRGVLFYICVYVVYCFIYVYTWCTVLYMCIRGVLFYICAYVVYCFIYV